MLRAWPAIRSRLLLHATRAAAAGGALPRQPEPTLQVYYGFSEAFVKHGRATTPGFDAWHVEMLELLQQVGRIPHRPSRPPASLGTRFFL